MKSAQKSKKISHLNYYEERFIEQLIEKIKNLYPDIKKIILYGSKARGDFLEDSDMDLLFVTERPNKRLFPVKNQNLHQDSGIF